MMTRTYLLVLALSLAAVAFAQDISGHWTGGLPQSDRTYYFTLEVDIVQTGTELKGKIKTVDPTTKDFVIQKFVGSIDGGTVAINEYEVVDSDIKPGSPNAGWCIKTMKGGLSEDEDKSLLVLEGTWYSSKAYLAETAAIGPGECAPGQFTLIKKI